MYLYQQYMRRGTGQRGRELERKRNNEPKSKNQRRPEKKMQRARGSPGKMKNQEERRESCLESLYTDQRFS